MISVYTVKERIKTPEEKVTVEGDQLYMKVGHFLELSNDNNAIKIELNRGKENFQKYIEKNDEVIAIGNKFDDEKSFYVVRGLSLKEIDGNIVK